jgi:hypothetical protein
MPEGYRSRLHNDVVPLAPRRPSSIATAIGRGLGALADAGNAIVADNRRTEEYVSETERRIAAEEKRRAATRLSAGFAGRFGQAQIDAQRQIEDARGKTAPGAPGWDQTVTDIQEKVFGDLLDEYGPQAQAVDEELGQRFGSMVQSATLQRLSSELGWAGKVATQWEGDQFEQLVTAEQNGLQGVAAAAIPDALKASMLRVRDALEGTDYDGTAKAHLLQLAYSKLTTGGALTGLESQGAYSHIEALVGSGDLDTLLGDHKANWLETAKAGTAAQAKAAEQQIEAQRDTWRTQRDDLKLRLERGGDDAPTTAEINAFLQQGQTLGVDADELREAGYLATDNAYASTARGLDDNTLTRTVVSLQAKRRAGNLSGEEKRNLDMLEKEHDGRGEAKGEAISTLWKGGAEGQTMALAQVAAMPEGDAWSAASKAGQPKLFFLGKMPPRSRQLAIEGATVRASKGGADKWLPTKPGGKEPDPAAADAAFASALGPQLAGQMRRAGTYDAMREAALDYYVGNRAREGGQGWAPAGFSRAIKAAAGATQRPDGKFQGGLGVVRGRTIELPDRMTPAEFDSSLSRGDFSNARYAGGAVASKADILAHYMPVPVGSTSGSEVSYRFIDAQGRLLMGQDGRPFQGAFKVRR